MHIQSNDNNISMYGKWSWNNIKKSAKQKILDAIPEATFDNKDGVPKNLERLNNCLSNPAGNRAVMGATAIVTQPAIDYYNKRVDKDTREVSRNRTIAKIIAGTSVGILVRGACYKLVERMTDINGKSKYSKALLPDKAIADITSSAKRLSNYRNALSMSVALIAMLFTNVLLDAPLTVYLTNKLNAKTLEKKEVKKSA